MTSPTAQPTALMRIGTVQSSPVPQADLVWVSIDGAVLPCSFFTNYVPVPGDRVIVTQSGTDWFVVGGRSGFTGNLIVNGALTAHQAYPGSGNNQPYDWTIVQVSGTSLSSIVAPLSGNSGFAWATGFFSTSAAGDYYLYSTAFPVTPGQVLYVETSVNFFGVTGVTTTMTHRVGWFHDGQTTYSGFASESTVDTKTSTSSASVQYSIGVNATVPAGISYGRLAIRCVFNGGATGTPGVTLYGAAIH